jgi:aminopeptidase YwaD
MTTASDFRNRIAGDREIFRDFEALCAFGGRLSGTESERLALDYVAARGAQATGVQCRALPVSYTGWHCTQAELTLADGTPVACHPLVRSVATPAAGLSAEVVDLGRGTPEEFEAHRDNIAGRIVLVRHELMFVAGTVHRRRKYELARAAGAVGFLIAGPIPNGLIAGSSGRGEGDPGIPAVGISPETAARLARTAAGWPRVTLNLQAVEAPSETRTLLFDMPGQTDEWVVLSAHVDGHDINESAMDNGSGVASALSAGRALAPLVGQWRRGIRLAFFSVEEWALTGSARYVASMSEAERQRIALNVNLDSVAGSSRLAALTSGFAGLEPFLLSIAEAAGQDLRCVRPMLTNSDHANFALAGIPAFRMVAGYDEPMSNLRFVLTPGDTRDKVAKAELAAAAQLAAAITAAACQAEPADVEAWRR